MPINDTDKTIVALLWHESIIDLLDNNKEKLQVIIKYWIIFVYGYIDNYISKQLWFKWISF